MIEWVNDAIPLGDYLGGKKGAHTRYYPRERDNRECATSLRNAENKRTCFDEICQQHSPCFRHFFLENFVNSEKWYSAVKNYTQSVAVSSMVGHVLGIGDRLEMNIMVHQKSGAIVHIDFGFVFEQGAVSININTKLADFPSHF